MVKTGVLHVHSTVSYDGAHTLEDLVLRARRLKWDFIGMTEHAETLDEEVVRRFVQECRRLSTPEFLVIPGIEFPCSQTLHILGLGVERLTRAKEPVEVARFIRDQGGLAIIAHPSRAHYRIPPGLESGIDGIEIWNARYDGWFVPNDRSIALWRRLQNAKTSLIPVGGQDLHAVTPHGHVRVTISCDGLDQTTVLRALRAGRFVISNRYLRLRPASLSGGLGLSSIACSRRAYLMARAIAKPIRNGFRALLRRKQTTTEPRSSRGGQGNA